MKIVVLGGYMNDKQRLLIQYICDGDIKKAQQQARIILNELTTAKDEMFKKNMLRKLDTKPNIIELPYNLREFLIAEDVSNFPENRFVLRPEEAKIVEKVMSTVKASERLFSFIHFIAFIWASARSRTCT